MNAQEAIEKLNSLSDDDPEDSHGAADSVLIAYLKSLDQNSNEVADTYQKTRERIGFWYA